MVYNLVALQDAANGGIMNLVMIVALIAIFYFFMIRPQQKKQKEIKLEELTREEKMKYEIAEELGLLDRVMTDGWRSLSSKETGRIGGLLARRKRSAGQK